MPSFYKKTECFAVQQEPAYGSVNDALYTTSPLRRLSDRLSALYASGTISGAKCEKNRTRRVSAIRRLFPPATVERNPSFSDLCSG